MACATLKRTLDFDPVHNHGRPSKRRRCVPVCISPNVPSTKQHPSPFGEVCPKLTPGNVSVFDKCKFYAVKRESQPHPNIIFVIEFRDRNNVYNFK